MMRVEVLRREADLATIAGSGLFDAAWYLRTYPDVSAAEIEPAAHYYDYGAAEGRNPGPNFDAQIYAARRPDVTRAGHNPLLHFLRHGIAEIDATTPEEVLVRLEELGISLSGVQQSLPMECSRPGPLAVFVTHDANVGGAPAVLASIAAWFVRHTGYDVRIVCMEGGGWVSRFKAIAPTFVVGTRRVAPKEVAEHREALRSFLGCTPAFTFINSVASGDYCLIDPYDAPRFAYVHELPRILEMLPEQTVNLRHGVEHVFCDGAPVAEALANGAGFARDTLSVREAFVELDHSAGYLSVADKAVLRRQFGWDETPIVMGCGTVHWRKQPEVFVRAAAKLKDIARFVWIGAGEDLNRMRALARSLGIGDRIEFLGHRDDFRKLVRCADVFALTSLEDPFPLVCLDAGAAGAPSVIFREAGGITAFVEPEGAAPAGAAITLGDEAAYIEALRLLLSDEHRREALAQTGHARVLERYTVERACLELLGTIRRIAKLAPRVSVLVPAYNSAAYLDERLASIDTQTFKDVEIILRDDASKDESLLHLNKFAAHHPLARVEAATENSGSVFSAWEKCIEAASGDLVWIAEADDACAPTFLERAIAPFAQSGMRLVHGRSIPIGRAGEVLGDHRTDYLDRIASHRWDASHIAPARQEIDLALGRANTIPNASGVVVRRTAALRAIAVACQFHLAGDWAFYAAAIHGGRIGFAADAVNYHRRHDATVTHGIEGSALYFQELANVGALVRHLYGANEARDAAFVRTLEGEAARFGRRAPLPEGRLPANAPAPAPGVLFGIGDFAGGGAQMFAVRFANGWVASGAPVVLFTTGQEPDHPAVAGSLSPEVPVLSADEIAENGLEATLREWGLDLVVTGHWWADRAVGAWQEAAPAPVPWAIAMHGCHENVLDHSEMFPDRLEVLARAERHCALWIWTAHKNRRLFEEGLVRPRAEANIVNGFEPVRPSGLTRAQIGLPDDALVFTLASRAIEEKGWFAAREAIRTLRGDGRRVHLVLIGDGPAAAAIGRKGPEDGITLVAHTDRLADYIALSDVCLLPSWFAGESLPLVLIEFLAQGKPAIVSDIGMCPWAIDAESEAPAGLVVPRVAGRVPPEDLANAMALLADEPDLRGRLAAAAPRAFSKFDFQKMLASYRKALGGLVTKTDRTSVEMAANLGRRTYV